LAFAAVFFIVTLILSPTKAHADLQQEMDAMFGTMTNATSPTAHLGQRRGVISAGSVVSRNRVMSANMVSFIPPSFSAGCGGIDLFGGSFSFINMNQFVDLMRAVASNAAGYAFQLAINAMCPDCGNVMSDLQKKVQQLNQMFSNSCQLAQGLVNDAASVLPEKVQSDIEDVHHFIFQGRDRRVRGFDQFQFARRSCPTGEGQRRHGHAKGHPRQSCLAVAQPK